MQQKSAEERKFWAQFDALDMGTGWDDEDIKKPQIMIESYEVRNGEFEF